MSRRKPPHPKDLTFSEAAQEMAQVGYITDLRQWPDAPDGVYLGVVNPDIGPVTVCRNMARHLPGTGFPGRGDEPGISWRQGSLFSGCVTNPTRKESVEAAQGIARSLIGREWELKWSIEAICRNLLEWVEPGSMGNGEGGPNEQFYTSDAERLLDGIQYGYHECTPGRYAHGELWDVSACYYHMLTRLKTLHFYCGTQSLLPLDTDPAVIDRFKRLLAEIGIHKGIRNRLAGCMAGPTMNSERAPQQYVCRRKSDGRVVVNSLPWSPGRFRHAGLLVVRTGWELMRAECVRAGTGVVYSNVDCALLIDGEPSFWKEHGFGMEVKTWTSKDGVERVAAGPTHVKRRYCYKVGGYMTMPYDADLKQGPPPFEEEVKGTERPPLPVVGYAQQWL